MQNPDSSSRSPGREPNQGIRRSWLIITGALVAACLFLLWQRPKHPADGPDRERVAAARPAAEAASARKAGQHRMRPGPWNLAPGSSAEETVAGKVSQFARNRREVMHRIATRFHIEVPGQFEHFFDAAEAGQWDKMSGLFDSFKTNRTSWEENTRLLWPTVLETYGVAEVAHDWPAQQLLDYGEHVLGSLRPDMIYVGGTDPGRFIPTLLNETSDGEHHIVLTQNALADSTYLDYVRFLYADRLHPLSAEDSESSFQSYLAEAKNRFQHDQEFPNEPKQIHPGETIQIEDGRVQVSGQVAVMALNEILFQKLLAKNPEASFAMEQSFPLTSTYPEAAPLGPIMELRVTDPQNALTAERATETVDYWSGRTQQLLSDPAASGSPDVCLTWSKMAAEQAALLLGHNFTMQAEEQFRYATQLSPANPEAVLGYVQFLMTRDRRSDAIPVVENALRATPNNGTFRSLLAQLQQAPGH